MGANRIYDVGDKVSILIDKREYVSKILRITDIIRIWIQPFIHII